MPTPTWFRVLEAVLVLSILPTFAQAEGSKYGTAGPWSLYRDTYDGKVEECYATMSSGRDTGMIFSTQLNYTAFGFKSAHSNDDGTSDQVEVWFDSNKAESQFLEMPFSGEWRIYNSPNDEPDGLLDLLANAGKISFALKLPGGGVETSTFALKASNEMTKRTFDCFQNAQSSAALAQAPVSRANAQSAYNWINYRPGQLGPHLVSSGNTPDGWPVYVCGGFIKGGFHPGMVGAGSDVCSIGFGGAEHRLSQFQVLTGHGNWKLPWNGEVPADAIEGGYEADGRKLYICREAGTEFAGKYRPGLRGCNMGDGGSEVTADAFEILTF